MFVEMHVSSFAGEICRARKISYYPSSCSRAFDRSRGARFSTCSFPAFPTRNPVSLPGRHALRLKGERHTPKRGLRGGSPGRRRSVIEMQPRVLSSRARTSSYILKRKERNQSTRGPHRSRSPSAADFSRVAARTRERERETLPRLPPVAFSLSTESE